MGFGRFGAIPPPAPKHPMQFRHSKDPQVQRGPYAANRASASVRGARQPLRRKCPFPRGAPARPGTRLCLAWSMEWNLADADPGPRVLGNRPSISLSTRSLSTPSTGSERLTAARQLARRRRPAVGDLSTSAARFHKVPVLHREPVGPVQCPAGSGSPAAGASATT